MFEDVRYLSFAVRDEPLLLAIIDFPGGTSDDGSGVEDRAFWDDDDSIPDRVRLEVAVPTGDRVNPDSAVVADASVLVDDGPFNDAPLADADVGPPFACFSFFRGFIVVRPHADHAVEVCAAFDDRSNTDD